MVNPAWGKKRVCSGCSVRFYDLKQSVPTCPKCGTTVDMSALDRRHRHLSDSEELSALENLDFTVDDGGNEDLEQNVLGEEDRFDNGLSSLNQGDGDDL